MTLSRVALQGKFPERPLSFMAGELDAERAMSFDFDDEDDPAHSTATGSGGAPASSSGAAPPGVPSGAAPSGDTGGGSARVNTSADRMTSQYLSYMEWFSNV